jgi:hypothetical protein
MVVGAMVMGLWWWLGPRLVLLSSVPLPPLMM